MEMNESYGLSNSLEIKNLKDTELGEKLKTLASQERKLTQIILWHIAEVDRRKLFLYKAYPSLFEYLVQEIGYSEGAAQRRIDAARLLQKVPEISKHIEEGSIHLNQLSKMQKICRQIKKQSGKPVEIFIQKDIVRKLVSQNGPQTDLILAQEFNLEAKTQENKQIQRDESVRIEMTFTKEEMELMKKAQNLLSNKTAGAFKDTLIEMAQRIVNSHRPKVRNQKSSINANFISAGDARDSVPVKIPTPTKTSTAQVAAPAKSTATVASETLPNPILAVKTVTPRLKKEILHRDRFCQFKDPKTGKICGTKKFLEIDHIQPRFAQGSNQPNNLRVLCKNHNLFRYRVGL